MMLLPQSTYVSRFSLLRGPTSRKPAATSSNGGRADAVDVVVERLAVGAVALVLGEDRVHERGHALGGHLRLHAGARSGRGSWLP